MLRGEPCLRKSVIKTCIQVIEKDVSKDVGSADHCELSENSTTFLLRARTSSLLAHTAGSQSLILGMNFEDVLSTR